MGDRGNITVYYGSGGRGGAVTFYTHWNGDDVKDVVRNALARGRDRWNDEGYLARIIFGELTREDPSGTTGFGIYPDAVGAEGPTLQVHIDNQVVIVKGVRVSFEDFIKSDEELSRE